MMNATDEHQIQLVESKKQLPKRKGNLTRILHFLALKKKCNKNLKFDIHSKSKSPKFFQN